MKKLSLVVFLPVALILFVIICHAPRADPLIRSWSQFDSNLSNTNSKHASLDDFLRSSPSYRTLVKEGDERVFREMVAQGPIPFVPIVGFLGLKDLRSPEATDAAFQIYLRSPRPPFFSEELRSEIRNCTNQTILFRHLSRAMEMGASVATNLEILLLDIKPQNVWAWYKTVDKAKLPPTVEAVILDCFSELTNNPSDAALINSRVNLLWKYPGLPRLVYLTYAKQSTPTIKELIEAVIQDESLSESSLWSVFSIHRNVIPTINLDALPLNEQRKKRISSMFEKISKRPTKIDSKK